MLSLLNVHFRTLLGSFAFDYSSQLINILEKPSLLLILLSFVFIYLTLFYLQFFINSLNKF